MATPTELTHKYFRQKQCHNPKEMHMIHYQHWDYTGERNGIVYEWTWKPIASPMVGLTESFLHTLPPPSTMEHMIHGKQKE